MKPFLLLVGLFLIPFLASAQQLNEHGLKMVSEIESLRGGLSRKFTFQYDDNSRLEEMNVYYIDEHLNNWELRVGFKIVNGNLQRCEYSDESNVHTEYGMNQRGQVAKFAWWYPNSDDSTTKQEYLFDYVYYRDFDDYLLNEYIVSEWYKKNKNSNFKQYSSSHRDILGYYKKLDPNSPDHYKRQEWDYGHPNDINMCILRLLDTFMSTLDLWNEYIELTEWVNIRNPYFIFQEYRDWEYVYDDSGNLTEIREYLLLGEPKLENTVKIKYYYGD